MPSSTSNSNAANSEAANSEATNASAVINSDAGRPGFVRLTASDRPGIAQPVPERDIPSRPWGLIILAALVMFALMIASWEWHWRDYGVTSGYRNSLGQWAAQRRRIDTGEGNKTVLIGSSRVLFDVQLPVWEKITSERPIQLSLEGTSSLPVLEDLADNPNFTGRLLVGVAPDLFFSGFAYRADVIPYYHKQGPSQRSGHWISQHLFEPYLVFYDPDFALDTIIKRQAWPARPGVHSRTPVRKLMVQDVDRNSRMWRKVEVDPEYRALARSIWAERFAGPPPPMMNTPEKLQKLIETQISRAEVAINKLRARGVRILFVRPPSAGEYYAFEQKVFPRATTWDVLLKRTNTRGIHFEDYPEMQHYQLPEWSHLSASEANRFTATLVPIVEREFQLQENK